MWLMNHSDHYPTWSDVMDLQGFLSLERRTPSKEGAPPHQFITTEPSTDSP
jgi:hypothetical protein